MDPAAGIPDNALWIERSILIEKGVDFIYQKCICRNPWRLLVDFIAVVYDLGVIYFRSLTTGDNMHEAVARSRSDQISYRKMSVWAYWWSSVPWDCRKSPRPCSCLAKILQLVGRSITEIRLYGWGGEAQVDVPISLLPKLLKLFILPVLKYTSFKFRSRVIVVESSVFFPWSSIHLKLKKTLKGSSGFRPALRWQARLDWEVNFKCILSWWWMKEWKWELTIN